ncbi:MAG: SDR family NAD(P)-dependent oxidoreductase, partial [Ignavibacteria bacterium]
MQIDLTGKKAIVCGSSQGIGKAAALKLAVAGAEVTLIARDEAKLKSVLDELSSQNGQAHSYIVADFSQPDHLRGKMKEFMSDGRMINILVNNTGGPRAGEAINAETTEFLSAFTNHLICNQIMVQSVVEGMKKSGYGRIINIISTSVKQPLKGLGVSNTIRGAVASWA